MHECVVLSSRVRGPSFEPSPMQRMSGGSRSVRAAVAACGPLGNGAKPPFPSSLDRCGDPAKTERMERQEPRKPERNGKRPWPREVQRTRGFQGKRCSNPISPLIETWPHGLRCSIHRPRLPELQAKASQATSAGAVRLGESQRCGAHPRGPAQRLPGAHLDLQGGDSQGFMSHTNR